jgi:alkylation response protein AidB-like acyl-CoA dehydrogenase
MNFSLTETQRLLRARARAFAETELRQHAATWDEEERLPEPMVKRAGELGLLGLTIPVEYGGGGLGGAEAVIVIEELAKACANTTEIVFDALIGPIQVISHFGTPQQKRSLLPKAARGDLLMGIAVTEPHAGSGATDMVSRAAFEGDDIVLNGHKAYVEDVGLTNSFLVYAKFDDRSSSKAIGGVIVEKGRPGFTVGPPRKKLGVRGTVQADLFFENCRVPKDNLVVPAGGFSKLMAAFNLERCGNAAMSLGIAAGALDEALRYAETRTQFGRPLCEFQGLQWKFARMAMELDAARLLVYRAVTNAADGLSSIKDSSMAKAYANEMAISVTNDALQVLGARGFLREMPLQRMYRDARAWAIAGGTVEVQLNNIASELFGRRFSQRPAQTVTP